tara:strand:+ start:120 stop:2129 length:2010 start_codon:yes stop_codon:yes gene_type:complete
MRKIGDYDITKTFITVVDDAVPDFKLPFAEKGGEVAIDCLIATAEKKLTKNEDNWFLAKAEENLTKKEYPKVTGSIIKDLIPDLEAMGFTNIVPINDGYEFRCDQHHGKAPCPLCDRTHGTNQFRIRLDGSTYKVKNFSTKCVEKPVNEPEEGEKTEYELKKEEFESNHPKFNVAKILKPTPMYVWSDEDTLVNKQQLTEVFEDYIMDYKTPKGEAVPFTKEWFRDKNKKVFEKADFCPYSTEENKPDPSIYNMFKGFRASTLDYDISPEEREERVKPFLQLLKVNTKSGGYEYALNWCANQLQNPETDNRAKIALVFQGEERGGKTELWNFLGTRVIGEEMYAYTHDPDKDVFSAYPTFLSKKILCVIDEADCYKHEKKLFGYITAPTVIHRPMYVGAMKITATHNLVFTSNLQKQVKIAKDGGKFAVFRTGNELNPILAEDKQGARAFWDNWWKVWKKDDRNVRAVYDYLMNHKIPENYDWVNERPTDSETHKEMRLSDLSPIIKFVEHFITSAYPSHLKQKIDDDNTFGINMPTSYHHGHNDRKTTQKPRKKYLKAGDFFELFKAYYPKHTRYDMDAQTFATRINSELKKEGVLSVDKQEVRAFHKSKSNGYVVWKFDREAGFAWLKARHFTIYEELPTETVNFKLDEDDNLSHYEIERVMKETIG